MKKTLILITLALGWQVWAQQQRIKPDSKVTPCDGCLKPCDECLNPPEGIKIICQDHQAKMEPPEVKVAAGLKVSWTTGDQTTWTIKFDHKSPCQEGRSLNNKKPSCEIGQVAAGQYKYTVKLTGCRRAGHGTVTVINPPTANQPR